MNTAPVEAWLRESIGLDPESVGRGVIARAIARRLAAEGVGSPELYVGRLRADEASARALVEEVVVPETWFFRDEAPFALVRAEAARRRGGAGGRPLRLLSLPCATGEEACSLAIMCFEAGLGAGDFQVDARDISAASLAEARRGVYGENSFRGVSAAVRARWFSPVPAECSAEPGGWRVDPSVRAKIHYAQANALEFELGPGEAPWDFVFCRNLLIYLDLAAQAALMRRLVAALAPDGVLCVGHAESALALRAGLAPWPRARSFAFGRAPRADVEPSVIAEVSSVPRRAEGARARAADIAPAPFADFAAPAPAVTTAAGTPKFDLGQGRRLADAGRLDEAAALAESRLHAGEPDPEAYYLLGLVNDARGETAAAEAAYRKALYLAPRHVETLAHLAALLEQRGERDAARRLRERARQAGAGGVS